MLLWTEEVGEMERDPRQRAEDGEVEPGCDLETFGTVSFGGGVRGESTDSTGSVTPTTSASCTRAETPEVPPTSVIKSEIDILDLLLGLGEVGGLSCTGGRSDRDMGDVRIEDTAVEGGGGEAESVDA